jgi:sugar O-acyltransferase (sialic acid O-acetyltransferase NeuD family)
VQPLYILGTGLLAEEFYELAETSGFAVQAFVENMDPSKVGRTLCGRSVIWVDTLSPDAPCICALSTTRRTRFIEQVAGRSPFATLVHPSSVVLPSTQLGEGTVVSTGVLIGSNSRIGRHVFLNRGSRVGHHTHIGDFVTIQPGANIAGANEIGDQCYIGMGAIIVERLKIGRGVTVAAGSVVKTDIPDHALVAGSPAVIKKRGIDPH